MPTRIFDVRRTNRVARALEGSAEGVVSLVANMLVVVALIHWAFPRALPEAPQAISVEIVKDGPTVPGADRKALSGEQPPKAAPAPQQALPTLATPAETKPEASATPPQPSITQPQPATPPEKPPAPDPIPMPSVPAFAQPQAAPAVAEPPSVSAPAETPPAVPLAPPPIDQDSHDPTPHLIAAPPDPRAAAQQAEKNVEANASRDETGAGDKTEPAKAPQVLTAPDGTDEVPAPVTPTPTPPAPKPARTAAEKREAENTARLAAALPFSQSFAADPNRAALSGSGSAAAQEYRGAVYGLFSKADDLVEAAKARKLKGQAVVVFSIDDTGALTSAVVAVSSGNAEIDQTALAIIRKAAPFPPPPPGAPHKFSPAIGFGLDD